MTQPPQTNPAWDTLPARPRETVTRHLRSVLLAGLVTALPLFVTVWFSTILYGLVTKFTTTPADALVTLLWGQNSSEMVANVRAYIIRPLFAVALSLIIVYVLGLLGTFVIGRQILAVGERFIANLPLIKGIYGTTKQVIGVFRQGGGGSGFQRVVLVEFPRLGTWTIAFVTRTVLDTRNNQRLVCVFIPMTPNPTSGFFQMFDEKSVRDTDWTVDQGIKIVLSGGLLAPEQLETK